MRPWLYRTLGIALICVAMIGFLFSLVALVSLPRLKAGVTDSLMGNLKLASDTLDNSAQGLQVADQSLQKSIESVTALQDTITSTAQTINATTPMVDTMAKLARQDLPNTITTAQTSLAAAQDSAKIIDGVLRALSSIPFVPKDLYNPPVPLDQALGQVSASLDPMPAALSTMEKSLTTSRDNLNTVQGDFTRMAANISDIKTSLQDARVVVDQYSALAAEMQSRLSRWEARLPGLINLAAWVLAFVFLWIAIAQVGLFLQGWELFHRKN